MNNKLLIIATLAIQLLSVSVQLNATEAATTIEYYKDGAKKSSGQLIAGKREGHWVWWYKKGVKRIEGYFSNNTETGPWMSWYESGKPQIKGQFRNGLAIGEWTLYSEQGQSLTVDVEENFDKGTFSIFTPKINFPFKRNAADANKTIAEYYPKGQQQLAGQLINGNPEGNWTLWHDNGTLQARGLYQKGNAQGLWQWWDKSGRLIYAIHYNHGQLDGEWTNWTDDHQKIVGQYKDNLKNGLWTVYNPSGTKVIQAFFINDKLEGKLSQWFDNGNKKRESYFKQGMRTGTWSVWRADGQKHFEYQYENDQMIAGKTWNAQGKEKTLFTRDNINQQAVISQIPLPSQQHIVAEGYFYRKLISQTNQGNYIVQDFYSNSNHKLTDPFEITNANYIDKLFLSPLFDIDNYNALGIEGKITIWHNNGQQWRTGQYLQGKADGNWYDWDINGNKLITARYQAGLPSGIWTFWYPNGKKMAEGQYQQGLLEGKWVVWQNDGKQLAEGNYTRGVLEDPFKELTTLLNTRQDINGLTQQNQLLAHANQVTLFTTNDIYRQYIETTPSGFYQVQDFYTDTQTKRSEPFLIKDIQSANLRPNAEEGETVYYDAVKPVGYLTLWHKNGQKQLEAYYNKNGLEEGLWMEWYNDGKKKAQGQFNNGQLVGSWILWPNENQPPRKQPAYYAGNNFYYQQMIQILIYTLVLTL